MEFLVIAAVIGLLPASIAHGKGYSFGTWWLYGAMLFIVALPHSLLAKPINAAPAEGWYPHKDGGVRWWDGSTWTHRGRTCDRCAENIKFEAKVCRYCGSEVLV